MPDEILPPDRLLTMEEVADHLGCHKEHVRRLVAAGRLQACDIALPGSKRPTYRITPAAVTAFIHGSWCFLDRPDAA